MKLAKLVLSGTFTLFVLGMVFVASAVAQTYPIKAINFVIPYPPGGASDIIARVLSEKMQQAYGQPVVPQNRPGANGNIATEFVAKAPPDGYTIIMGNVGPNAINPAVYPHKFDPIKGFETIVQTGNVPMVLVVSASLPVKNVAELLTYARAQKDPMIFATGGTGSATHLSSALLSQMGKVKFIHVQYKGDPFTLTDIAGGHISLGFVTLPALTPFLTNEKIKVLAVTTAQRSPKLPNIPTIAESGVSGYDSSSWGGVMAPAGTPPAVIASLNKQIVSILNQPDVKDRLEQLGVDIVANSPAEFRNFLEIEVIKWATVVKQTGIKLE